MNSNVSLFFDKLKAKKVGFIGLGVTHTDLVSLFCSNGVSVEVFDKRTKQELGDNYYKFIDLGVKFHLGDNYLDELNDVDVIFRTPGMNYFSRALVKARSLRKVVTSEMEVFFELCPCKIYAVTGSDGKTTTTTIISEFFKKQGKIVHLGGNIGRPLLPIINSIHRDDVAVVELSSFQLISMRRSPDVAVITNISPNHLDVHKDMDEYIQAKKNLILHQDGFSKTVLNFDDNLTNCLSEVARGDVLGFSMLENSSNGVYLSKDGNIYFSSNSEKAKIINKDDIILPGLHNIQNYLAAIASVYGEVDVDNILAVAKNFSGVNHRLEFVRELDGIRWYNDSIATTPTRTIAGLNSFNQKVVLIMGGYDKKILFEPLIPVALEKSKLIILMGDTSNKLENLIVGYNYDKVKPRLIKVCNMDEAVKIAKMNSNFGDLVLMSPACASFDMYNNFESRGNHFKELVKSF